MTASLDRRIENLIWKKNGPEEENISGERILKSSYSPYSLKTKTVLNKNIRKMKKNYKLHREFKEVLQWLKMSINKICENF